MRYLDKLPSLPDNEKVLIDAQKALRDLDRNIKMIKPAGGILAEMKERMGSNHD